MVFIYRARFLVGLLIALSIESCSPSIHSFNVQPLTTTSQDSVKVNWDVSGKATLLFHEVQQKDTTSKLEEITPKYLKFILSVQRGSKEVHRMVQVTILPDTSSTEIVFATTRHGDTLIAEGEKNILRWGKDFKVMTISSSMDRDLFITHSGKTIPLAKGEIVNTFQDMPVEGHWQLQTLLTPKDKKDMSNAPDRLRIKLLIQFKK